MGHFFAMGISLLVFLYTMRAAIRSTILTKYKSKLKTEIRQTSRVPGTEDIPTRIIASYVWQRLGSLTQTIIIVLPFMVFTLVLVASQGHGLVFRTIALIIVVLGAATVAIFLIAKRFLAAIRTSIITVWLLSIVGACIGGKTRPNPGVLGTICVVVTTVCGIILALVPQNLIQRVWKRTTQVLLPLWLVLLPFTIMLNYYFRDHWRPYQLILGSLTVIIVFGLISGFLYGKAIRWLPQICGLCALVLGIPLTLAWTVWPMAEDANEQTRWVHLPREVSIAMSAFAGALFLVLAPALTSRRYRWSDVWWHASCFIVLFALPITLVWYLLPYNGRQLPLFAKIAVTAGAAVVCPIAAVSGWLSSPPPRIRFLSIASIVVALPVTFVWAVTPLPNIPDISLQAKISVTLGSVMVLSLLLRMLFIFSSEGWRLLAWTMSGAAMMSWIPLLVWVTDWKVFEHVRKRRTIAIHVSWATSVAILVVWMVLWKKFFSISRTWIPNLSGRRRRKNDRLLGLAY
jgi:glycopeptide antibiotics resistance protein